MEWLAGWVGGINNSDLTGIMCRLGSLIMIGSSSSSIGVLI